MFFLLKKSLLMLNCIYNNNFLYCIKNYYYIFYFMLKNIVIYDRIVSNIIKILY